MKAVKEDIGKRVVFKLTACNWMPRTETRIIHGVENGNVLITHNGWQKCFQIKPHEIKEIF